MNNLEVALRVSQDILKTLQEDVIDRFGLSPDEPVRPLSEEETKELTKALEEFQQKVVVKYNY